MGHALQPAYDMYMEKLKKQVEEVMKTKKMLNELAVEMGNEPPFPDVQAETVSAQAIRLDQFHGKVPSTALSEYLQMRGRDRGAAKWEEIWAAFRRGAFNNDLAEDDVKMTLKKNTTAFKYFKSNDAFGLKEWYPRETKKEKTTEEGGAKETSPKKRGRPKKIVPSEPTPTTPEGKNAK